MLQSSSSVCTLLISFVFVFHENKRNTPNFSVTSYNTMQLINYFLFYECYVAVEAAEQFTFFGLGGNLVQYLTNVLHEPNTKAVMNVNTWSGVSSIFPLFGGFIADSYLGRFNTIIISSIIYLLVILFKLVFFLSKSIFFFDLG